MTTIISDETVRRLGRVVSREMRKLDPNGSPLKQINLGPALRAAMKEVLEAKVVPSFGKVAIGFELHRLGPPPGTATRTRWWIRHHGKWESLPLVPSKVSPDERSMLMMTDADVFELIARDKFIVWDYDCLRAPVDDDPPEDEWPVSGLLDDVDDCDEE